MNVLKKVLIAGGCAALMALGTSNTMAQGRNFDPAQMKQDTMDRLRDQMEIKDDQEWSAIEPKLGKVYDAGREVLMSRFAGMRGNRRRNNNNGDNAGDNQRQRRGGFGGEPSPAFEALQKAIEDKAPTAEIKTKLAAVRAEFKEKQDKLLAAQEDLRSVLTPRQEAVATVNGLLQ